MSGKKGMIRNLLSSPGLLASTGLVVLTVGPSPIAFAGNESVYVDLARLLEKCERRIAVTPASELATSIIACSERLSFLNREAEGRVLFGDRLATRGANAPKGVREILFQHAEEQYNAAIYLLGLDQPDEPSQGRRIELRAINNLATLLLQDDRDPEALEILRSHLELALLEREARFLFNLAVALEKSGDPRKAFDFYLKASSFDPHFDSAFSRSRVLLTNQGAGTWPVAAAALLREQLSAGRLDEAQELARTLLSSDAWFQGENYRELLEIFGEYFVLSRTSVETFEEEWLALLDERTTSLGGDAGTALEDLTKVYVGTFSEDVAALLRDEKQLLDSTYWLEGSSRRCTITRMAKFVAGLYMRRGYFRDAADRFALAWALQRQNLDLGIELLNIIAMVPRLVDPEGELLAAAEQTLEEAVESGTADRPSPALAIFHMLVGDAIFHNQYSSRRRLVRAERAWETALTIVQEVPGYDAVERNLMTGDLYTRLGRITFSLGKKEATAQHRFELAAKAFDAAGFQSQAEWVRSISSSGRSLSGSAYGVVVGTQGQPLPGVRVELTGQGPPITQYTNKQGQFRFSDLRAGRYEIRASFPGFSTLQHGDLHIQHGRLTPLEVELSPSKEDVITVTTDSPLLDHRKVVQGTSVAEFAVEKMPAAQDPWAEVLQTPGVLHSRINVGGNESSQQAVFIGAGLSDDDNSFAVDGVLITDMVAIGGSPTYYDFDQLKEIQVSTGGSNIEKITSGPSINLVTKRGSNNPRGSARFFLTDADEHFGVLGQATPDIAGEPEAGDGDGGLVEQLASDLVGNNINEIVEVGFEAGGPIVRDKLWVWSSYGRNDLKQFNQRGDPDNTLKEVAAIKFNVHPRSANSLVASWSRDDKLKDGRTNLANRSLESSWDQAGPTEILKVEDTHVFSSDFYLTGLYSYVDGGFQVQSKGGSFPSTATTDAEIAKTQGESVLDSGGLWQNGWYSGISDRNTNDYQLDGSYFFNTGNLNHEVKFGASYRKFDSGSSFGWPGGRNFANLTCEAIDTCGFFTTILGLAGDDRGIALRTGETLVEQEYIAGWVQDTLTVDDWTVKMGIRYDLQHGRNEASTGPANPLFPDILPSVSFAGNDGGGFEWETFSPRVGLTYAVGAERKTWLRASLARFAEQLQTSHISRLNPLRYSAFSIVWDDRDGDDYYDTGEPFDNLIPFGDFTGFDPADPVATAVPNETDSGLNPELTDELILGVEHAFLPEFVVGLDLTLRNTRDVLEERIFVVDKTGQKRLVNRATDYVFDHTVCSDGVTVPNLPTGEPWCADYFRFARGITPAGGSFLTNGDREVTYVGASLNFTKRLTNRWMARGYFTYGAAQWDVPGSFRRFDDPTRSPTNGDVDERLFLIQSAAPGPFTAVPTQSSWSANFNGMYQVAPNHPWGFNMAANLFAREGYPLPYEYADQTVDGLTRFAGVTPLVDEFRTDDVYVLDLRLQKDLQFTDSLSAILSLDAFNVTNEQATLERERSLHTPRANFVNRTLSPRIYRLGFRLNWR